MLLSDFISNYLLVLSTTALTVFLFFKLPKHVHLRAFALTNSNVWVYVESGTNELIYKTERDSQTWSTDLWFPSGRRLGVG